MSSLTSKDKHDEFYTILLTLYAILMKSCIIGQRSLLLGLDLSNTLHEVLVLNLCRFAAQSNHARLHTHRFQLCTVEVFGAPCQFIKIPIWANSHLARMDLHDASTGILCWHRELNLSIQPTGAQQGGV